MQAVISEFLGRTDKGADGWTDDTGLWGDGLAQFLEAAELSAMLEDEFGSDPFFAGGDLPETVATSWPSMPPSGPNDPSARGRGCRRRRRQRTAVVTPRARLSYGALLDDARRVATALRRRG